ncbi:unnamed protein product, partial [Musa acuminata subsp. burmannicoides]
KRKPESNPNPVCRLMLMRSSPVRSVAEPIHRRKTKPVQLINDLRMMHEPEMVHKYSRQP